MTTRVTIVTQDDPFYMPLFFKSFFDNKPDDITVVEVVNLQPFDESFRELVKRMYRLYGPKNFVRRGLHYVGRTAANLIGANYSVSSIAQTYDVPVSTAKSVNTEEFLTNVEENDIDVILSASAPEIFDIDILEAPNWGCLNVHTAELPKYRGMLPTFWALYHNEDEIGVTVHTMEPEIDQGDIVRQTSFPVRTNSLDKVIKEGKRTGGRLATKALSDVENNTVSLEPMEGESSYFSFPTVEERKEFQNRGGRLL